MSRRNCNWQDVALRITLENLKGFVRKSDREDSGRVTEDTRVSRGGTKAPADSRIAAAIPGSVDPDRTGPGATAWPPRRSLATEPFRKP